MTNSVIRHYGTDRGSVPHPVLSNRCRTTTDESLVTCLECMGWLEAIEFGYIDEPVVMRHNHKFEHTLLPGIHIPSWSHSWVGRHLVQSSVPKKVVYYEDGDPRFAEANDGKGDAISQDLHAP